MSKKYLLAWACLIVGPAAVADSYLILDVNIIPMTSEVVMTGHSVLVRDDRIVAICENAAECRDSGAEVIDGRGKYLIPGFADMHGHVDGLGAVGEGGATEQHIALARRIQGQQLRQYVMFGVTTIRDAAGGPLNLSARARINAGEQLGPRLVTATRPMDGDPPLLSVTTPFSAIEDAVAYVHKAHADGYDMIKVYSTLTQPMFDAIIDTATELGMPVIGHLPMQVEFEHALKKGMRSIEHMSGFDVACAGSEAGLQPVIDDIYQGFAWCTPEKIVALANLTAQYEVWVDPTLLVADSVKTEYARYTTSNEVELKFTPPLLSSFLEYMYVIFDPRTRAGLAGTSMVRQAIVKALSEAGVPLLLGTDTMASGYNVHQELQKLVESGLSPYQALTATTSEPARYFEREGEFGTIVEGATADLLLLDGDPFEDIRNSLRIRGVMLRGDWITHETIEAELEKIQSEFAIDRRAMVQ